MYIIVPVLVSSFFHACSLVGGALRGCKMPPDTALLPPTQDRQPLSAGQTRWRLKAEHHCF